MSADLERTVGMETPIPMTASSTTAEERLSRIEAALQQLTARQAAGPAPAGVNPPNSPLAGVSLALQAAQLVGVLPGAPSSRKRWKDWPVLREVRFIFGLYFDKRYTPSRAAQLGVPALLLLLVVNFFFWAWFNIFLVSTILEHLATMVIAIVLYRLLAAELVRYSAVVDYLERVGG